MNLTQLQPSKCSGTKRSGHQPTRASTLQMLILFALVFGVAQFFISDFATANNALKYDIAPTITMVEKVGYDLKATSKTEEPKVIFSVSMQPKFVTLLPLIVSAWRRIHFEPVVIVFGCRNEPAHPSTSIESVLENITSVFLEQQKVKYYMVRSEDSTWKPGLSRYVAAGMEHPDQVVILADADLVPLNGHYFDLITAGVPEDKIYFDWDYNYDAAPWKVKCNLSPGEMQHVTAFIKNRCQYYHYRVRSCYLVGRAQSFRRVYPYQSLEESFGELMQPKYLQLYKPNFGPSDKVFNNFDEYLFTALSNQKGLLELSPNGFRNHTAFPIMGERLFSRYGWESNHSQTDFQDYLRVATDVHFKKEIFSPEEMPTGDTQQLLQGLYNFLGIGHPMDYFESLEELFKSEAKKES